MNSPVAPGDVLDGKYRVERVIGAGGMGVVVAATHLELGHLVAMKFLLAEGVGRPDIAVRFIREARAAARIRGEHVARVLDVGRLASGSPYIVMEYLEGHDLEEVLRAGPLSVERAIDYLVQACDAMAEAHRLGIVHRDLKPANLFLTQAPDGREVIKVLDFGISKSAVDTASKGLTNPAALIGSPLYMSPEQMRSARDVDQRTDIWSLGAVLFEFLAGRPPFDADNIPNLIASIMMESPAPLRELRPEVPEGLALIVARCLEKNPEFRFADVGALSLSLSPYAPRRSLETVERAARILGSMPPPPESFAPSLTVREAPALRANTSTSGWAGTETGRLRRPRVPLLAVSGLAAVVLVVGGYAWLQGRTPAPRSEALDLVLPAPASAASIPPNDAAAAPRVSREPAVPAPVETASAKASPVAASKARKPATPVPSASERRAAESAKPRSKLNMELKP